jgi:hypothetical protein
MSEVDSCGALLSESGGVRELWSAEGPSPSLGVMTGDVVPGGMVW